MIWKHLTQRDAQELTEWTIAKLDHEQAIVEAFIHAGDHDPHHQRIITDEARAVALQAADRGDLTLLREVYPELTKHLPAPPDRGRPRDDKVWEAARDVGLIRRFWKQHKEFLDGKFKRSQHRTGTITVEAEQIAADRWHVDVEAVRNRLHKKRG
jgi:hypothetical protein